MQHLAQLNDAQREAVITLRGPVLVLAGAGTGKTRVITYRMAELIRHKVPAEKILSVTFTNKAAKEMLERTKTLLGGKLRQSPWISTFHSLCVDVLRQDITHLGYPQKFVILDRGDQESYAKKALRDIKVTEKQLKPGDLLSLVSRWKSTGVSAEKATSNAEDDREFLGGVAYRKYQQSIRAAGAVDFDDLLLLTEKLFNEFPEVLARHQQRFSHVQIDEYQDTNGSQFRIIESLVREHGNLCVVGDDDQSIYGWRGAEVRHILGFAQQFPGAKVIRLEENYRCTDEIIGYANRLVRHNRDRHQKVLKAFKKAKHEVRSLELPDEQMEAERVVGEIRLEHEKRAVPYKDFAILFRTNEQPRIFEDELRRRGIPYVLMGSQSFYDRKEIKDLICYMKAIARPDDEQALLRIINTPARGIGDTSLEKINAAAVREGSTFWEAVHKLASEKLINQKTFDALQLFRQQLQKWQKQFDAEPGRMDELMHGLIQEIDYFAEIDRQYKEPPQQAARKAMVEDYVNSLADYIKQARQPSLMDYLAGIALERRDEEPDKEKMVGQDAVKLLTLHSAKGLEFPRVYMVGMEEGILPHKRSVDATENEIAEERRLAYVGVTRAQEQLTLTRAATRRKWGKPRQTLPSRFLFEMKREEPR